MRILIVGAGATGGYFGGRLLQAGRDVTFLVRAARSQALAQHGLIISSPCGDARIEKPPTIRAEEITQPFDLVILTCKSYDLNAAILAIAPAVTTQTTILPLLNGLSHIEKLEAASANATVLGGQCVISTTLEPDGTVRHLNTVHSLTFGARDTRGVAPAEAVAEAFAGANFEPRHSRTIMQEMWNKWVVLASMAGATCVMRAPIGAIVSAPGGTDFMLGLIEECRVVAQAEGYEPAPEVMEEIRAFLTTAESQQTSSMLRDIRNNGRIEADHIIGDMVVRGKSAGLQVPRLDVIFCNLKAYEVARNFTA